MKSPRKPSDKKVTAIRRQDFDTWLDRSIREIDELTREPPPERLVALIRGTKKGDDRKG
jgi:putative SOS response-associated peptidase YedK